MIDGSATCVAVSHVMGRSLHSWTERGASDQLESVRKSAGDLLIETDFGVKGLPIIASKASHNFRLDPFKSTSGRE